MRIFNSVAEAVSEVGRDLVEMGLENKSDSVQGWVIDREDNRYDMKELIGYSYKITDWDLNEALELLSDDEVKYAVTEHENRVSDRWINPGIAWTFRSDLWKPMLDENNRFDYTYNERMRIQLSRVIKELEDHPNSRQVILTVYDKSDQASWGGKSRVPCSLHYQFIVREKKIHIIYSMRSCDYFNHYKVDVVLALNLLEYMSFCLEYDVGSLTHNIGSLHCFRKDWENAGIF